MNRDDFDELIGIMKNAVEASVQSAAREIRADIQLALGEVRLIAERVNLLERRVERLESRNPPEGP